MEDKTIKNIALQRNQKYFQVYLDYLWCHLKYGATKEDYNLFQMYLFTNKEKNTIVTEKKNQKLIAKHNDKNKSELLENKIFFHQKFRKLIKIDWIILTKDNIEEFQEFVKKHPVIIAKSNHHTGIEKIKVLKKDIAITYQRFCKEKKYIIEEAIEQHDTLSKLHPYSINTIHIVTIKNKVVAAYLRIGVNKNIVDNLESGSIFAPINISTGIIDYPAVNINHETFQKHPLTKEEIIWLQIPKWPRIKRLCENASKVVPEIGYASFEICMGKNDPILLEASAHPLHMYYNWKEHFENNMGLMPALAKASKEEE